MLRLHDWRWAASLLAAIFAAALTRYSILSPIAFTTFAYFSVSLFRYAAACSGVEGAASTPIPA